MFTKSGNYYTPHHTTPRMPRHSRPLPAECRPVSVPTNDVCSPAAKAWYRPVAATKHIRHRVSDVNRLVAHAHREDRPILKPSTRVGLVSILHCFCMPNSPCLLLPKPYTAPLVVDNSVWKAPTATCKRPQGKVYIEHIRSALTMNLRSRRAWANRSGLYRSQEHISQRFVCDGVEW